jgi:hypothetical protein
MVRSIKKKRGSSDELIIAVVRKGSVEELQQRLPDIKSWYERFGKSMSFTLHSAPSSLYSFGGHVSLTGSPLPKPHLALASPVPSIPAGLGRCC